MGEASGADVKKLISSLVGEFVRKERKKYS
jgi:hypothetical protein